MISIHGTRGPGRRALGLSLLTALGCAPQRAPRPASADPTLFITHVTVIDPRDGSTAPDCTIAIRGDRIVGVTGGGEPIPAGSRTIDAAGKFVIPGLWDMHIHTFFGTWVPGGEQVTLPLLVANGVTGVRDMGSELEPILAARAAIAEHRLLGPRMVIAGPMLDGPKTQFPASIAITTPDDGRRAVQMLAERGVDFIKIQSYVPRDAYFAIAEECRKRGLVFVGHVPDAVRGAEAAAAGQKSFEHLIGIFEGSSTAEDASARRPQGPGAVPRHLRRRQGSRADADPARAPDLAVPDALLGARPVAGRRDRRQPRSRRAVRPGIVARQELAAVHRSRS